VFGKRAGGERDRRFKIDGEGSGGKNEKKSKFGPRRKRLTDGRDQKGELVSLPPKEGGQGLTLLTRITGGMELGEDG